MPTPPEISRREGAVGWTLVGLQFALIAVIVLAPAGANFPRAEVVLSIGVVALVAGVGLAIWGALALGRALTPHPSPRRGAPLVTSGPFALVPHPIYLGIGVAGVAAAVLRGGLVPLAAALALCLLLVLKARYEEQLLRRAHGSVR